MKNKIILVLICSVVLFSAIGTFSYVFFTVSDDLESNIELNLQGETQTILSVKALNLYPGKEKQYTINLLSKDASSLKVRLDFRQKSQGTLQNFVIAKITVGENNIEKLLYELFDGSGIEFDGKADKILISYLMPDNVGNEAQGAETSFDIKITVSKT